MGRTTVFNGIELVVPDAYSALDLSRLLQPSSAGIGIVALVGESVGGKPGLHVFDGGTSPAVVKNELKGGPGANMTRLALRSGRDPLVQGGASTVLFYKTNASTQASLDSSATNPAFKFKTKQYGAFCNLYTGEISTSLGKTVCTIRDENGIPETSVAVGVNQYLSIQYTGNGSAATMTFQYVSGALKLQTTLTGQTDTSAALNVDVSAMNLGQIAQYVASQPGYSCSVVGTNSQVAATDLDLVLVATAIKASAFLFKASIMELANWAETQSLLVLIERSAENAGSAVPQTLVAKSFSGAVDGNSTNSSVQNALNDLLEFRVNIIVPLFSSDNQDGSTVVLASVNSMVVDHCASRSSILGRSECQSFLSFSGNKDGFKAECARLNSRWAALVSQSITDLDIDGNLVEFPEYGLAVVAAQTQSGSPIGTPLVNRSLPISGLSQDVSWSPTVNAGEMIKAGCLIAGPDENNINRFLNGDTTWLGDSNNGNIFIETVESLAVFAFNHRRFMKERFLGISAFTKRDIMDAILESSRFERDITKSIKNFDPTGTNITQMSAGVLRYEVAVVGFEGIRFILPTVVAVRESV